MADRLDSAQSNGRPEHGADSPPEISSWHAPGNLPHPQGNLPHPHGRLEGWRSPTRSQIAPIMPFWAPQQQFERPVEFRPEWNAFHLAGNFSVAMATTQPSNASEWQLYRVLQRANLLQYYDTFIAQGGDDVQQLCEAGEEEFLEIMALVGMASKPLHVRRLQKALQEWVANPAAFQGPVASSSSPAPGSITAVVRDQNLGFSMHSTPPTSVVNAPTWNPQPAPRSVSPAAPAPDAPSPSSGSPQSDLKDLNLSGMQDELNMNLYSMAPSNQHSSSSPLPTPVLVQNQIDSIAEAATRLSKELPAFDAKELNMKKQINREIQNVMQLTDDDPGRLDELRKYAAIYGRFDSKRKNDRPMSLHEISVNEAAAQLCRHMPTLLTRREDLFPLARQVVRDSGYQYSKGHSSVVKSEILDPRDVKAADVVVSKKPRLDPVFQRMHDANPKTVKAELDKIHREERMNCINQDMMRIRDRQEAIKTEIAAAGQDSQNQPGHIQKLQQEMDNLTAQHNALVTEKNEIIRKQKRAERYLIPKCERLSGPYGEDEFTDSSNFPSGSSSPLNSHDAVDIDLTKVALCAANFRSSTAQKIMQETLFDEGLRIAQQYGMADFAEELKELKSKKLPDDSGKDSDSDLSDSPTPSECGKRNGKQRKLSDSNNFDEMNGKEEIEDISEDLENHNNNENKIGQVPESAGFETMLNGSSQSSFSNESEDENTSVINKINLPNNFNFNGTMAEISHSVQNGD